ncbi:hypothetical protein BT67DRAFT_460186 [Trichocladium antarcticum]|uniref:Chromo domain-containing protein n=1 Tax=Trichocladium antarcticum TaxID=1450529 RepID=A0AAN6UR17_9PEZI|nr:hypothetical protein BT67DRAFT_460186 [Trichocladium antarcticum]
MPKQPPAKPPKQKPRKSAKPRPIAREPTPDEVFYQIRDVVDEKRVRGKLFYKVDWADNPTTGERYNPTWEPAENVTAAAVADWEREKRRRPGPERAPSSIETDSQPVQPPNWRAKRRRDSSVAPEDERSPKRWRSVDSGYTSTQSNDETSQPLALPERVQIVLELSVPPGFNPAEYQKISLSQPVLSSQENPSTAAAAPQGRTSQRTIPDSQEYFESLRTQSTTQSAARLNETSLLEGVLLSAARGTSQAANVEGRQSRSGSDIPSRQPGGSHQNSTPSAGLLEGSVHEPVSPPSARTEHPSAGQDFLSNDSLWSGGFLTQPAYELPVFTTEPETQTQDSPSAEQSLDQGDHQDRHSNWHNTGSPGIDSHPSAGESHPHFQAAQRVPLLDSEPGGFLTQVSEAPRQSEEVIPDTVQKQAGGRSPRNVERSVTNLPSASGEDSIVGPQESVSRPFTPASDRSASLFFTPRMDGSPGQGTPLSAVDLMRQIQAEVFGSVPDLSDTVEAPLLSPSLVLPRIDDSTHDAKGPSSTEHAVTAAQELNRRIGIGAPDAVVGAHGGEYEQRSEFVAPADLTASVDHILGRDDSLSAAHDNVFGGHQILAEGAEDSVPTTAHDDSHQSSAMGLDDQDEDGRAGRHFVVTLPMAANCRSIYLDTISENKGTMIEFSNVFADSDSSEPDGALVAKMDRIFERLLNLCDLPAYDDPSLQLHGEEMMKHATNSNSKFSFVYEFLNSLWGIDARILILSQTGRVFEYLDAVVSAANITYTILGQESSSGEQPTQGLSVILAVAGQDLSKVEGGVDVVLAFDDAARSVELPASLGYGSMAPIVLPLVITYSLEHCDHQLQQLEPELDGLERKNALNLAVAAAKDSLRDPIGGVPEPHEAAELFANFLKSRESGLDWEPQPLPDGIFDMWLTQERTQEPQNDVLRDPHVLAGPGGQKRPHGNIQEGAPKRPRLLLDDLPSRNLTPLRMSDVLMQRLVQYPLDSRDATPVEVPAGLIERMAEKIEELESRVAAHSGIETKLRDHVTTLESQLRSYERTIESIQPKYMDALRDRASFEKESKAAISKADAATGRLEAQKSELAHVQAKLADATAAMANSSNPDLAKLARTSKERDDAVATIEKLNKKVLAAQNDLEYSRKAYQDASNAHSELSRENAELRTRAADLEQRAGANLVRIHQLHADNERAAVGAQIDELQALLDNRERELDRALVELRALKNGRRETRGSSVPRSPRTAAAAGVMSPRLPGRAVTGSRGTSPALPGGLSSDGSTPVPSGMTYFQAPGAGAAGGRWGHLRD